MTGRLVTAGAGDALRALAGATGAFSPERLPRGPLGGTGRRVGLWLVGCPARTVLELLALTVAAPEILAPAELPAVTVLANNAPWDDILAGVAAALDLSIEPTPGAGFVLRDHRGGPVVPVRVHRLSAPPHDRIPGPIHPLHDPDRWRLAGTAIHHGGSHALVVAPDGATAIVRGGGLDPRLLGDLWERPFEIRIAPARLWLVREPGALGELRVEVPFGRFAPPAVASGA